jgi:hypothetical protein
MSEFRRPNEDESENSWAERANVYWTFVPEIDELFTKHFDDVDRGVVSDGTMREKLDLETGEDGPYFSLVRSIHIESDSYTDYALHMGENTPSRYVDNLYRIKSGIVHKLYPTYEQSSEIIYEEGMHDFAAGVDYNELKDQPIGFKDVARTLNLAKEAKVAPKTFNEIANTNRAGIHDIFGEEDYENAIEEFDPDNEEDPYNVNAREHAKMAVDFFNYSIDKLMDNANDIKKENDSEVLQKIKRGEKGALVISISRDKYGDFVDDRRVVMVHQDENNSSTQMLFQTNEDNDEVLQSSIRRDDISEGSKISHAFMDPNDTRKLFKFIQDPRID